MNSAIINDVHFGARHDNADIARQQKKFFNDVFFPYCISNNIKNVFCFGDFYDDRRNLSVRSLKASRKMFLEPLRDLGMKMTIIPGNHDLEYKNSFDLNSLKEGLGYFTSTVDIIDSPKEVIYGNNTKVLWLPWINDENKKKTIQIIERSNASTVFAHLELNGFETSPGVESRHINEMITSQHLKKFGSVFTGHYHHKSNKGNVHYLGAQYQFTWADVNSSKYFHVWDSDNPHEMKAIKNPVRMYHHYHYDDTGHEKLDTLLNDIGDIQDKHTKIFVLNRENTRLFDSFVNQLNSQSMALSIDVIEKEFISTVSTTPSSLNESDTSEDNELESSSTLIETEHLVDEYIDEILEGNNDYNPISLKTIARQILLEAKELA